MPIVFIIVFEKQVPGAAVEVGRADEIVARLADVLDRKQRGGLARSQRQPRDAALERGDALFEHGIRRVHDARVDIAEFGQPEQIRGVLAVAELVARRLVDRHRDGGRRRIAPVPRMEHERFRMLAFGRHLDLRRERASALCHERGVRGKRHSHESGRCSVYLNMTAEPPTQRPDNKVDRLPKQRRLPICALPQPIAPLVRSIGTLPRPCSAKVPRGRSLC